MAATSTGALYLGFSVESPWGNPQSLIGHDQGSEPLPITHNETHGSLDVNEAGDRFAVFTTQDHQSAGTSRQVVVHARKAANDANWNKTAEHDDNSKPDTEVKSTYIGPFRRDDRTGGAVGWAEGSDLVVEFGDPPAPVNGT